MNAIQSLSIIHCADATDAAKRAAVALSQKITETNQPILLLLSGGSALQILDIVDTTVFSSQVTIGVLDERVSADPAVNNFLLLSAHISVPSVGTINTVALDGESPEMLADRFEKSLRDWKASHPDGKIIATVGMGPDGHTFGIMPYPEAPETFDARFVHTDRWVVGYDAGNKNQFPLRATTTVVFSNLIDASIWYVCGVEKTEMLKRALNLATLVNEVPARIIQDMRNVTLFTDCSMTK